ncbi:MAG: family acetyltransferase [Firmicutes bacterium]|nr:family acetyltransferase [Bacillota bacterium]
MGIRSAKPEDWKEISELLDQLGYPETESFIKDKIEQLLKHPDEKLLVFEKDDRVVAMISIHFIPQIALKGDFARISYFVVDRQHRNHGIGKELEQYCFDLATERKCDRIEVHCHARRRLAHRFYFRQGFEESPKYLMKMIESGR